MAMNDKYNTLDRQTAPLETEKARQHREIGATVEAVDDVLNKLAVFDKISSETELDQVMPELLASLGRYSMSDRAYIFTWASQEHQILRMTHEWCAEGAFPTIDQMQELNIKDMPNWIPRLKRGEAIVCADWEAERSNIPQEYATFDGQGIHSLIVIPVFANNKLNGYIGFDNPEQSRAALSVRLLSSIGGHISSLKDNFFMVEELNKKQEALQKNLLQLKDALADATLNSEIISSISKLYSLIYRMDLVSGTYEEISAGSEMHTLTGKHGNISEGFGEARENVVSRKHQQRMKEFLDVETLADRLQDTESISAEYLDVNGSWNLARFIVKKRDQSGKVLNVLYVVRQIDKEKQAEIQYKQEQRRHNQILSGLSVDYTIALVLDLDTDDYEIIFSQQTNHAKVEKNITKFADYVARYAETYALPEFQEPMKHELGSSTIKERFRSKDDYHFSFETVPNAAGLSCFQAHIVKQYDGEHHYAFLGFRSVDEIVQKERFYIDALQTANQALKEQMDLITASLPGGVKISNDDSTYSFKYVSEQFANMLGYATPEELIEASDGSILGLAHPDDFDVGLADALEQYSRSDHYATTYRMKCKDGSWKYIEDRGNKIRQADGTIEHWNLILDNDELMKKTIALEIEKKANQNKSDFLSRMSHDMRTPLNGIIGLLDICKKHPDDKKLVDSSRLKARIAADHLLSLINDTLELNKLESMDIPLYQENFCVPVLLHEVETIARMHADERGITIHYESDVEKLRYTHLTGSPLYVKQILLNLLTNATKYNKENGQIYCYLEEKVISESEVSLEVTIRDTGIGMSQEFLKDIFKPFVQADHGPRSTYMGTGLGMAIVKNLVDRMNGTVQIESQENIGTTVKVQLPFKIAESIVTEEKMQKQLPVEQRKDIRVLLAEDNELNREIAAFILKDEKIKVTEAVDGQQAVSLFLEKPEHYFDVILMDIMMPSMDGYEATRTIRNSGKADAKTIPIIAMTANAFDDDRKKAKAAGMDEHMAKPLDTRKLIETIERFCAKKQ
ncbi:ATP-binding protein [Blautia sp. MSJ-19]|uniref:ATP-binding protein n=1 Tax=Blautia sp. MSJ-19 TaxID=2841517 RepID=UPI001C0F0FBC|nr:ATP-binding protein [Blautia sp. MSJ-19]MBU5481610.1 response regulator [Blautia sp. MSJ-19]